MKYNDIEYYPGIDYVCDCLDIDLTMFDYVIATPPCNYYSRANWRRDRSDVALSTKHLLPTLLDKLIKLGKPFIVENVMNSTLLPNPNIYIFDFGGHTFYSNCLILSLDKSFAIRQNKQYVSRDKRDGNYNVDIVIKQFLCWIGELAD